MNAGVIAGLSIFLAAARSSAHAQRTTATVQATQPGKAISPDLFGIFFEDLNYAADGGLYAEMIKTECPKFAVYRKYW